MSATLSVLTDGDEEPPEFAVALEDVYQVSPPCVLLPCSLPTSNTHQQSTNVLGCGRFQTLKDADAPEEKAALRTYIDARREALLQCWQLADHRTRSVEQRRQGLVASYGGKARGIQTALRALDARVWTYFL